MADIYDTIEERLRMNFDPGPAGSYIYKGNRLIQGVMDLGQGINRDPSGQVGWMINQAIEQTRGTSGDRTYTTQELMQQAETYLDQIAQSARYLEPYWDVHYSQAMQTRMGSSRKVIGERLSPLSFTQYRDLRGYGVREKDGSREAIDLARTMRATPGYVESEPGVFRVGTQGSRLPKRFQLEAQFHVNLAGREREGSPIRMEGATGGELGYRTDAAVVWGGGLPAGQGMMQAGEFSPWGVKRNSFFINPEEVEKWEPGEIGDVVMRGGKVNVGNFGGVPYEVPVKSWDMGALREVRLNKRTGEVSYAIDWAGGAMSLKDQGIKSLFLEGDIGQVLSGGSADVMFERPSDVRQFAYGVLSGQTPERLKALGVPLNDKGQAVWSEGTDRAMTRAFRQIMREDTSMETMTMRYDESMAAPFIASYRSGTDKEAMRFLRGIYPRLRTPNPLNVTGISQDDKGIWTVTRQVPVTRTRFQASPKREWEYGKTALSLEEIGRLSEVNPGLSRRLWREGASTRLGYQQPIRAQAATFAGAKPGKSVDFYSLPWDDILNTARELGGEEYSSQALMKAMAQHSKKGTMLHMDLGDKRYYLPSAGTMSQHMVLSPEGDIQTRMPSAYAVLAQRGMEYEALQGIAGADQPLRDAMAQYLVAQKDFAAQPGVRKMAQSTQLRNAVEGVYHGFTAMKPGELFLGDERLKRMFGLQNDEELTQLKELLPFNNPDRALATGFRRPTSDSGQVGGLFNLVSGEELLRRQPELAGADLSNVMGLGGIEAAMQRGDFDADRFLSFLASTVKRGPEGLSLRSGVELSSLFVEQNRMGQLLSGFEQIAPQSFKRHAARLRQAIGERPTAFASAFFPGVESNELAKWAEDLKQFGSLEDVSGWLRQGMNLQASVADVQGAFTQQSVSKMMMGVSYNQWIRTMSSQLPRDQQRALAELYQRPLDNAALPEPVRKLMELQQTYNIAGGLKEGGKYKHAGGYAKIFHDYVSDEAGIHAEPDFVPGGPAGLAGEMARIASDPASHEVMAPEGWARLMADSGAPYEGVLGAIKAGGEGISEYINREWLMRAESPLAKTFMSAAYRRGGKKQFFSDQGAFVMNPESWQAQLAQEGEGQRASIWMAKPKRSSMSRYFQNLWGALKSPFTPAAQKGYLQELTQGLGSPQPAAGGQPPAPPQPPVTTAAPAAGGDDDFNFDAIPEIPYGNGTYNQQVVEAAKASIPFSPKDLTSAEREQARKTPAKVQEPAKVHGGAVGAALSEAFGGGGNVRGWWKKDAGTFVAGVTEDDPVKNFGRLRKEYRTLSAGLEAALQGENLFEWQGLDLELEGMKSDPTGDLTNISRAVAAGRFDKSSITSLRKMKRTVMQQRGQLADLSQQLGEPMPEGAMPTDLLNVLAQAENGLRGGNRGGRGFDVEKLAATFDKMQKGAEKFTGSMRKAQEALDFTEQALTGEFGSPSARKAYLTAASKKLSIQGGRLKASLAGWAGEVARLEKAGVPEDDERMIALRDNRDMAQAQLARIREGKLDVREKLTDMALEQSLGRKGHRDMALFGLAMLPWQLQFADQWGTAQSQQAFQYATGVDLAMGQAGFAAGYMPPAGLVNQMNQIQANQSWGQYYMGQGAAGSMGGNAFWANHEDLSRLRGTLGNYGRYLGYGLAGEMVAQQVFGNGLFTGEAPLAFQKNTLGYALRGASAIGLAIGGTSAAVDVANVVQDRTRTTWEGVGEAARNAGRLTLMVPGLFGQAAQWLGDKTGVDYFHQIAQDVGEGMATAAEGPLGDTESEIRDRGRKASVVYKRQKAILDAMKEQGLGPEQAATYSTIYSQMGVLDPQRQAQMAAQAFGLEQAAGLNVGQLAGSTMGIVQQLGYMPGSQPGLQQQLYNTLQGYAQNSPERFQALSAGLNTAAGMVGEWPARLGMSQEWGAQLTERAGGMLASGTSQWEVNRYIQNQTLSTPRAYSNAMRQMGFDDLATVDELGRPVTTGLQRFVRDFQTGMDRWRTRQNFGIEAEQLGLERQWMERSQAAETTIRDLRNRYRVEDADMGIASMVQRLEGAQVAQEQQATQREWFETQIGWRESDIQTSGARAATQRGWQVQDFAWERSTFDLQRGWQLQDMDEAIRYASGRQRLKLMEQRDRYVQMSNVQSNRMDEQEQRAAVQYGWGQEDREKQLERLKEEAEMRRKMMDQDAEQNQKSLELLKKQYEQAVQRRKELVEQILPAEKEQEKIQREQAEKGLEWREKRHNMDVKYFETMQPLQDRLTNATDMMQDNWARWQTIMEEGVPAASAIFLKEFGPDSDAFKAIERWNKMLNDFGQMVGGSGATGNMGNAVNRAMENYMRGLFERYGIPLPF
jgi:uncharacterized protein YidB (DUF937 family)